MAERVEKTIEITLVGRIDKVHPCLGVCYRDVGQCVVVAFIDVQWLCPHISDVYVVHKALVQVGEDHPLAERYHRVHDRGRQEHEDRAQPE